MKASWPVSLSCEVLGVSVSGYFEHQRRQQRRRPSQPGSGRLSDEALLAHMRAIHAEVRQEYGWPRMTKELCARGHRVGKERVRRLMQQHGIKARGRRKFVVTTDSKHNLPIAPDLLQRDFGAESPNLKWTSDITYIATDEGWLYLAAFIDLHSRMIVGWSMQAHMRASIQRDPGSTGWTLTKLNDNVLRLALATGDGNETDLDSLRSDAQRQSCHSVHGRSAGCRGCHACAES